MFPEKTSEKFPKKISLNKIPATIVTGFLGSGKTTLISNLLKRSGKERVAVIVNEFGALDIDADLISSCALGCSDEGEGSPVSQGARQGIYELANGCICCTVEEEFLPVMKELVARREDIDRIIIETSGLALPKPLVQAFNWPDIKQYCTVDAVITLVDGPAVAEGRFAHDVEEVQRQRLADESLNHEPSLKELLEDQLVCADLVVVSKADLLDTGAMQQVKSVVQSKLKDSIKMAFIDQNQVPLSLLLGLGAHSEERADDIMTHHDRHHHHGDDHEHAHDHFDSCVVELDEVDAEKLRLRLVKLVHEEPIMRIKGFAAIPQKTMRQVIQAVGHRYKQYFDRPWDNEESRKTQLVIIGQGLDIPRIKSVLKEAEMQASSADTNAAVKADALAEAT